MPTAARCVAALCLAVLALLVSELIKPLFEEDKAFGYFTHINVALGVVIGWQVIGSRVGRGWMAGINNGLTGGIVLVFWGLLIHSSVRMFELSMRNRYDGAFEAIAAVFEMISEYAVMIATPTILASLLVGSIAAGLISEVTNKFAS